MLEPTSAQELEAFTGLRRAERVRCLLQQARDIRWVNTVAFLAQVAAVALWVIVLAPEGSAIMLAGILLFSVWGVEQALGRRINALAELFAA